jgi:hypothetical protein
MAQPSSTGAPKRPPAHIATTKPSPIWTADGPKMPARRRPALIGLGVALVVIATGFGSLFSLSFIEWSMIDSHAHPSAAAAANAKVVRAADFRRLLVFGPAAALAGVPGVVLLVLGLRKR